MSSRPPVNPYIAGSPVTGIEMFYGRDDVFAFIQRNLIGRHRDSPILLYGQRRTGKTSVLYQLHRQLGRDYRCIFIDLHGLDLTGMGNFLLDIASSISRSLQREHQLTVPVPDDKTFLASPRSVFETVFLEAVWSALGQDHLVLMMDEMVRLEEEIKAGRIEREVFDYLRHLMQHYAQLNFIFSLGSSLEDMRKDYAYLFSVSLYHRISFLEPAAAQDLIIEPVREHYQVAPEAVTKILRTTSGHPYYTQLICHCLFDRWSRSPKPVMTKADVEAVLADAIELGSPNLTYVWEDSTPEEQAVMAGMAAAMDGEARAVTLDDARRSWQAVDVVLPAREGARALHSLTSREVVAGNQAHSFTVDLQRLWLEQHRRLEWVKEELAAKAAQWKRSTESWPSDGIPVAGRAGLRLPLRARVRKAFRSRRYLAVAAVAVAVAGYLAAANVTHLVPFAAAQAIPQRLIQLLPGDLPQHPRECKAASPPGDWKAPGLTLVVHCTASSLPGGNVYAYQMDNGTDSQKAWNNFNAWWVFMPQSADSACPPKTGDHGMQVIGGNVPSQDRQTVECGEQDVNGRTVPALALAYPASDAVFIVAQGAPGSALDTLVSWWSRTSTAGPPTVNTVPLERLLPRNLTGIPTGCSPANLAFKTVGLIKSFDCSTPDMQNGSIVAYQLKNHADYVVTWKNFNDWWGFTSYTPGAECPPSGGSHETAEGTRKWASPNFPYQPGQVLECEWTGDTGHLNNPAFAWTFPAENAFVAAWGGANTSFSALQTWWANNALPQGSPIPVTPSP